MDSKASFQPFAISDLIDEIAMGPFGSNIKVDCFVDEGVPVFNGSNLTGFTTNDDELRYVTDEKARLLGRALASRGDVVITHRGTLGQIAYIPNDSLYEHYIISQSQFRMRMNEKVLPAYLVYYFHTPLGQWKILSNKAQTGVPALGRPTSTFQKIEIELPDIDIQSRIVTLIDSFQNAIRLNKQTNDYLLESARALYAYWFEDYGRWDGSRPGNWVSCTLGELVTIKRGGSPRPIQVYLSDEGYRWLKISDVTSEPSPYILSIKEHIRPEGINKTVHLNEGSLVLSNSATPGIPKILDLDTCIHDGWLYFPSSELSNEWLFLYFLSQRERLVSLANGSVFKNLKIDIVKNFNLVMPDNDTLNSFQNLIQPLFEAMLNCARENRRLAELRDALLPRLMSGEIDVSQIELPTQPNNHLYG